MTAVITRLRCLGNLSCCLTVRHACSRAVQDDEDSKYAYNSDDDTEYGMANGMDL
jgi:hypothetical protein